MAMDAATILAGGPAFESLVVSLMQPDDSVRSPAEAMFEELKKQPDALVGNFLGVLRKSASMENRQFAAIMLRKVGIVYSRIQVEGCYRGADKPCFESRSSPRTIRLSGASAARRSRCAANPIRSSPPPRD